MSRYHSQNQNPFDSPSAASGSGTANGVGPIAHPRLRAMSKSKPYSRPSSFAGPASSYGSARNLSQLANGESAAATASSSRLTSSASHSSLPRSGSDSSLFSGIKSIFSKPFGWLATPSKQHSGLGGAASASATSAGLTGKRDSLSSFGHDLEDPESPSDRREGKRIRRQSPDWDASATNPYQPTATKFQVQGRAVSGFMLPALSPHVTLKPKSHFATSASGSGAGSAQKPLPPFPTNFSRPLGSGPTAPGSASPAAAGATLSSSKSMSYLDPPSHLLRNGTAKAAASPSRAGPLTRSKRMELASLADEDDAPAQSEAKDVKGKEREEWSPWKSRYPGVSGAAAAAASPRNTMSPTRRTAASSTEQRDYALPTMSPFRQPPPPSPLAKHVTTATTSGLTRSATTANLRSGRGGREVSPASGLARAGSLRPSGSMLFGRQTSTSINGDQDDRMSVDGESRQREGSVLDWFMRDQWSGREPGSPSSIAASKRLGPTSSTAGQPGHAPLRKGQLVWNEEEKVFVRESDLKASKQPAPVHKTEAERILWTLESMRKTPLSDARKTDLFPSIIGQSSRTWRKTINVPLSTAAAGDSAKRRRDRLGDGDLSIMISPYGRRKAADEAAREVRRQRAESADYRPSPSPSPSMSVDESERQASRSPAASVASVSMRATSSAPSASATPRRSSRIRQREGTHDEPPTPKAKKSTRKGSSKADRDVSVDEQEQATPRKTRGSRKGRAATADKAIDSPPPLEDTSEPAPAVPALPTITETAPSPGGPSTSSYQPGLRPQEGSSLRARSDSKRAHQSAATYSRSTTPSANGGGRYSAKEEDLPDLEELEKVSKIPLPSFAGISFAGFQAPPNGSAMPTAPEASTPALSQAAEPAQSLAPPIGKRPGGPLARLGQSTRPRASSPLAAGSIVPEPESPPAKSPTENAPAAPAPAPQPANADFSFTNGTPSVRLSVPGSTTPLTKPPASSSFFAPSTQSAEPKKTSEEERPSAIPNFFGNRSNPASVPASGTSTPLGQPAGGQIFDFGLSKSKPDEEKVVKGSSSFGGLAAAAGGSGSNGFSFSTQQSKPTESGSASTFSFGSKPMEPAPAPAAAASTKSTFSFGTPSTTPAATPTSAADKPSTFSFGNPTPKPAEPAKPTAAAPFSFGAPAAATTDKPAETAKSTFSFGAPSSTAAKPAEPAKSTSTFTFGQPPSATGTKEPSKSTFTFGAPPASTGGAAASSPFGTSAPTTNGSTTPTTTAPAFTFGKDPIPKPAESKTAAPSNPFGAPASTAAAPSPAFTFGAPAPADPTSTSTTSPFGTAPNTQANGTSNPFGKTATPAASTGFNFGQQPSTTPSASAQPPNSFAFGAGPASSAPAPSNPFGSAAAAQSQPASASTLGFNFGAPSSAGATTPGAAPSNPFGQQPQQPSTPSSAGFNFTFGAPNNSNAPQTPGGTFTFGAGAGGPAPATQTSSRPTTPAGPGFTFGAPNPNASAAGTGTAAPFAFGMSQQPAQSTTPAGAPPAPAFAFGAPPGPGTPTMSASTQPLFGAPTPDAGFSLGVGDPQTAGSPARKVKGLPNRRGGRR